MDRFGKIAMASLKVIRKDLESSLKEVIEDLGVQAEECGDDEPLEEVIEKRRAEVIKKVNKYFDKLHDELKASGGNETGSTSKSTGSDFSELQLSLKEMRHQLEQLQNDVNQLKGN